MLHRLAFRAKEAALAAAVADQFPGAIAGYDVQAGAGLVQIHEDAAVPARDGLHGGGDERMAIAIEGFEDIAVDAVGMHADQNILLALDIAVNQGEVGFLIDTIDVANDLEFSVGGANASGAFALHKLFGLQAVADQVGNRNHFETVLAAEFLQLGGAGHGGVLVHDFADDAG